MLNFGNKPTRQIKTVAQMVREQFLKVREANPQSPPLTQEQKEWLGQGPSRLPYPLAEPEPPSKTFEEALRGLRDEGFLASGKWNEQQHRANRQGADPRLIGKWNYRGDPSNPAGVRIEFVEPGWEQKMVRRMAKMGIPMFAHEVMRSGERQDQLKKAGKSKAGAGESPHQHGFAIDLIHSVKGWQLNDRQWALIGHQGKEIASAMGLDLEWGGDWKFYDPAHWEIKGWRSLL